MSQAMKRFLPLVAVAALAVVSGYVHGVWTDRWSHSEELEQAVARLQRVPAVIGEWRGTAHEVDPRLIAASGTVGYQLRRYENPRTGHAAEVLIACGRGGPMSVHTPDVCYPGAGYRGGDITRHTVTPTADASPAGFLTTKFTRPSAPGTSLRVYWSWLGGAGVEAPDNARAHFAGRRSLYKIYVIQELTGGPERLDEESCAEFMRRLVPELERALRPD